jgi:hypothetical protein
MWPNMTTQFEIWEQLREGGVRGGIARDIATALIGFPSFTVPSMTKRLTQATPQGVSAAQFDSWSILVSSKSSKEDTGTAM